MPVNEREKYYKFNDTDCKKRHVCENTQDRWFSNWKSNTKGKLNKKKHVNKIGAMSAI